VVVVAAGVELTAAGSSFAGSALKSGSAKGPLVALMPGAGVVVGIAGGTSFPAGFASVEVVVADGGDAAVGGAGATAPAGSGAERNKGLVYGVSKVIRDAWKEEKEMPL
jgi:hypothetical protein